ncbi:hypothetical protein ATX61_10725 [Oenococcus oeni]|nr:hypothetical protein ATX61_10725 [Oenococcus oeni]
MKKRANNNRKTIVPNCEAIIIFLWLYVSTAYPTKGVIQRLTIGPVTKLIPIPKVDPVRHRI